MPFNQTVIGALKIADPKKWVSSIQAAMGKSQGRVPEAAHALGISPRQLWRWLEDPRLSNVERAPTGVRNR